MNKRKIESEELMNSNVTKVESPFFTILNFFEKDNNEF